MRVVTPSLAANSSGDATPEWPLHGADAAGLIEALDMASATVVG